ncbi:HEPN domain-containing protein [Nodosilinea sp. LEGE 07088]|uniref:HEPN domain-containing protein n=1 Tax=Nodosilinea sp. LEGE 07088 TaxID=2777968 RepID=UPI0018801C60|nr:HEPN domain-containing protein [Nodosilinea sp. LEGE 07088]MBE9140500.1 HEPN domain-containing protein [Nodosilinea sp. LEGE 07088]
MRDAEVFADEIFGLHVQQATEKCLKAWIAAIGEVYPFIHDLGSLLRSLEEKGYNIDSFEALQQYSAFAAQIRYGSLLETDQPIDREGAIALVSRLYAAAVDQVRLAGE